MRNVPGDAKCDMIDTRSSILSRSRHLARCFTQEQMDAVPGELSVQFCSVDSLLQNKRAGVLALGMAPVDVTADMRPILVDWMISVRKMFELKPESFFTGVNILDTVLARDASLGRELQLCRVTSLLIASKYHEVYPPEVADIAYVCEEAYTTEEILEME